MSEERNHPLLDHRGLAKNRIEALADGIFAVAMTLLVLDIKSPREPVARNDRRSRRLPASRSSTASRCTRSASSCSRSSGSATTCCSTSSATSTDAALAQRRCSCCSSRSCRSRPTSSATTGTCTLPVVVYGVNLIALGVPARRPASLPARASAARRRPISRPSWRRVCTASSRVYALIPLASMVASLCSPAARHVPLPAARDPDVRAAAARPPAPPRRPRGPARPLLRRTMKKILILGVNGFIGHHLSRRILDATDWEVYGMDMQTDRLADLMPEKRFHFFEGDITINSEWIEYHVKKCDTVLPLVAIATPATYVREPLRVFELDFEANLPIVRACVRHRKRIVFPSTSEVYGMCSDAQFDSGGVAARARPDQQAALDLLLREAADGPRDPRLRDASRGSTTRCSARSTGSASGLDSINAPKEGSSRVITQFLGPHRPRRADQARRRRHAEARVHLHRRRHRGADARSSPTTTASRRARSTTSATRTTTSRCASSRR